MGNPIKKLVGQTAIYGLSSIIGRMLNYLLVPLYTRLFLPAEYGVVTDLYAYVGFLLVFLTYGMETAFFRFSEKQKDKSNVFSTAITPLLVSSSIFILLMTVFAQQLANVLEYPNHREYVIWFAIIIGVDALVSLPFAKLRQENKPVKFAVFKFINIGTNIGLNLFFLLLCPYIYKNYPDSFINSIYSDTIGVGYIFISNLIASLITLILFLPTLLKVRLSVSKKLLKQMLFYGMPLLVAGLAGMVNEVIDRILLKYLTVPPEGISNAHQYTMSQIGIYGANYKLSILMTLFIQAFRYAAEPFFFSQQKEKNAKKTYANVMKYFMIFSLLIFLGITLYLDIARHFIDPKYWEGLKIVPVLLSANLFLGVIYNLSFWYKLTDKTKYGLFIALFGALITIALNIVLIPYIGYVGSAWATFACYFSMMTLSFFLGRKFYKINYDLKRIFEYVILSIGIYLISININFEGMLKFIINTVLLLLFLFFALYREGVHRVILKRIKM